jgi:integrase
MSYSKGTEFQDRIGKDHATGDWWFVCQRRHKSGRRVVQALGSHRRDAQVARQEHDAVHHPSVGMRRAGIFSHVADMALLPSPSEAFARYQEHIQEFVDAGRKSDRTRLHYDQARKFLFHPDSPFFRVLHADDLTQPLVDRYVAWRLRAGKTKGARLIKELKALQTALRYSSIPVTWQIRFGEIRPEKRERRTYDKDTVRRFINAMPAGSVERAFTITKIRTGMRNEELFDLRVKNVRVEEMEFQFLLRNKQSPRVHILPVVPDVIALLAPLLKGKGPEGHVFLLDGIPLREWSLRKRFIRASYVVAKGADELPGDVVNLTTYAEAAKQGRLATPPITSVGGLRHANITASTERTSNIQRVSAVIGHSSVRTTERYIIPTAEEVAARRAVAEAAAEAFPLT